jgi:hypothetical protein
LLKPLLNGASFGVCQTNVHDGVRELMDTDILATVKTPKGIVGLL